MEEQPQGSTTAPATGGATAQAMTQAQDAIKKDKAKKAKKPAPTGKTAKKAAPKAKAKGKKAATGGTQGLTNKQQRPGYVSQYRKGKKGEKTAGGNAPIDCNDKVAVAFRGRDLDYCYKEVAKALAPDETVNSLKAKYGKLNVGMQRMNLGNRLRGALNAK